MSNRLSFIIKKKLKETLQELRANFVGNVIWKNSESTLVLSPIVDFSIIPANFDLKKLTSCKVKKLMVEVGTGNGDFLSYIAKKESRSFFIGFEIAKDYFLKTKNNISKNLRLNAKVAHADAYEVIKNKFQDNSISKIFINFPDPWPKKKHWRKRFLTTEKLPVILSKMKSSGEIIFVTDHMGYADFIEEICKNLKKQKIIKFEISEGVPADYPETKYFRKWKKLGKKEYRTINITKSS